MPWVLQNNATRELSEWLMEHTAICEACRGEYVQQNRLRLALTLPSDIPIDVNQGLKRLMARIDAPASQELPGRSRAGNWVTRALVAAVLVQAVGIGVLGTMLWSEGNNPPYSTLSQASGAPATGIRVVPDATMKVAEWNTLLRTLHLQVMDGPNDVGAYTVVPMGSTATAQDTLKQLRASHGIRLAEPVAASP